MIKFGIVEISDFEQEFRDTLPETFLLLKAANLKIHPNVRRVTLHGSRGLAGGYRESSDIDLCLITDLDDKRHTREELGSLLKAVIQTTLEGLHYVVKLDLAAVFDQKGCALSCFRIGDYSKLRCEKETAGCMGIYKIQEGFDGFVPPITQVSKMYPFITVWER